MLFIYNLGNALLVVGPLILAGRKAGEFFIEPGSDLCSNQTVMPGDTCALSLRFQPQAGGRRNAALQLSTNDPASPPLVELDGTSDALFHDGLASD